MSIGLVGAHRVGKTTLAREVASKRGIPFVQTSTTAIFQKHGLDPAMPLTFDLRMKVQWDILRHYEEIYTQQNRFFITDRTPIDLLGYTFADIQGNSFVDYPELERYMQECFDCCQRHFNWFVCIQPGIPLVSESGKAAMNRAYMEHLNMLMIGFLHHPDQKVKRGTMVRSCLDMDKRIISIGTMIDRIEAESKAALQKALIH